MHIITNEHNYYEGTKYMPNYELEIIDRISLEDYSVIHDYMSILQYKDNITVKIENNPEKEIEILCNLFQNDNFNIVNRKESPTGEYFITAKKMA